MATVVELGSDFATWRRRETVLLRAIWRTAAAFLNEPTDPALGGAERLRQACTDYHDWRRHGLARGWQP